MEQFWILNYVARMNLFDAPTDIGISVMYMFSRISDFIPGSDIKTTISETPLPLFRNVDAYTLKPRIRGITHIPPPTLHCVGEGARQGRGHTLLVMVVFMSDPGPMKTNVICHATPRTEIEFGAIAHGHGRFYVRPPYGKIASPKCAWRRFGFEKNQVSGGGRLYHDMFPFRNG